MTQPAQITWNLVGATLGALASTVTIMTSVSSKDARCIVAKAISIESNDCKTASNLMNVDFIVQTTERESIESATVTFIFKGAPEQKITDGQGYVKNQIPLREDVDVIISKEGYETLSKTLNLDSRRDDKPVIYQLKRKGEQVTTSNSTLPSLNPSTALEKPIYNSSTSSSTPTISSNSTSSTLPLANSRTVPETTINKSAEKPKSDYFLNKNLNQNMPNGFYFISDSAYKTIREANQEVKRLKQIGNSQAFTFWIPDYPNLSGKNLFVVSPVIFSDRQSCANFLSNYRKQSSEAYCAYASKDKNAPADRF